MRTFSESSIPFYMIRGHLVKVHEESIFSYIYIYIYIYTYIYTHTHTPEFRVHHHPSLGQQAIIAATWQKWFSHRHNTLRSIETLRGKTHNFGGTQLALG